MTKQFIYKSVKHARFMVIKKFKRRFKEHFDEVLRTKRGLRSIAIGFAIGTFITILPTPGFNILLGLLIILIFPKVSKYALFTAFFVFNGIVKTPIYIGAIYFGKLILNDGFKIIWDGSILNTTMMLSKPFIIGILILDAIITVLSYHAAYHTVKIYRRRLKDKHEN